VAISDALQLEAARPATPSGLSGFNHEAVSKDPSHKHVQCVI